MEIAGILSLVFGIIGIILSYWYVGIFLCVAGLVLGIVDMADSFSEGKQGLVGLLLSILGGILSVFFVISDIDSQKLVVSWNGKNSSQNKAENEDDFMKFHKEGWENEVLEEEQEESNEEWVAEEDSKTQEVVEDSDDSIEEPEEEVLQPVGVEQEERGIEENNSGEGINYSVKDPIFYTYGDESGDVFYQFMQEITNSGDGPLYLKSCQIDIVDSGGHLIETEDFLSSCPDVIRPGEKGYFYNSIGSLMLNESVRNADSINVVPHIDVVESDENPVEYEVSDTSLTKDTIGFPCVMGRVTNNTGEDDSLLYVNVIFYNKNGEVIFISGVNVIDLHAGETKSFECSTIGIPDNITYEDIANYEVIARKMHYQF